MEFSLLLPVWQRDEPDYVARALRSSVDGQTRRPNDVVIVQDGPVDPPLAEMIEHLAVSAPAAVTLVRLPTNRGLGAALDIGLAHCAHDVVARMDADDVSLPQRFERQIPLLEDGADLVGSGLLEIGDHEQDVLGVRVPPTDPAIIRSSARFHDPFNHPTVVYRRSAVAAAGGYQSLHLLEDYWLFARMIASGIGVANVGEPLVMYRVGAGAYERRGGWALWRSERELQQRFYRSGFTTRKQYVRNVIVRGGYRFTPVSIRRVAYRRMLAHRGSLGGGVQQLRDGGDTATSRSSGT